MTTFSDLHTDGIDLLTVDPTVGNRWFVNSTSGTGGDAGGYGTAPATPFLTLDYAIDAATADNGDVIYLAAGHAETKAGAGSLWAVDKAGLTIIGLGKGAERATFTFSNTAAVCTISSASTWLENVLFVCAIDSVVAPLTISAPDCMVKDVEFRDTTDKEFVRGLITTATADRLTVDGLFYNGEIATGNACTTGIALVGVNSAVIKNCRFNGIFSTACINMLTTLSNNVQIENCWFNNSGTAVTKDVAMNIAACIYSVDNCFDAVAGYKIGGSNIVPVNYSGARPLTCTKAVATVATGAITHYTYMGVVRVIELGFIVTGIVEAIPTGVKWQAFGSTQAAATDLSAALDLTAFDPGSLVRITHDFSDAALGADDVAVLEGDAAAAYPTLIYGLANTSAIILNNGGAGSTGTLTSFIVWEPVTPGAYVVAA